MNFNRVKLQHNSEFIIIFFVRSIRCSNMYGVGRALSGPVQSSKTTRFSCREMHCQ